MTTLTDIRRALAATLDGIASEVKVAAGASDYTQPEQKFVVRVLVGTPSDEAEEELDALLAPEGPGSVREALEADRKLGGLLSDLQVTQTSGYRLYQTPGTEPLLGAEWTVVALA